jgi:hypothetical protein
MSHMNPKSLFRLAIVAPLTGAALLGISSTWTVDTGAHGAPTMLEVPTTSNAADASIMDTARANELIQRQPGFFVPNLGQWEHSAKFEHRSGPMTLFLEDRGWVIDLAVRRFPHDPRVDTHRPGHTAGATYSGRDDVDDVCGVALKMTFEGDSHVPEIVGEKKLQGHHNYFLGNDESRWRTGVPLYGAVRYENLYPGIDLRLREMNHVPEYDLLLQPGADLAGVTVHVEGAQGLSIASDGSLVIETALGPVTQPVPKTWQVDRAGRKQEVICNFALLGTARFGFMAEGWDGETALTIDPGLIWSTFLGGNKSEWAGALAVDASGVVTVAGATVSTNFPTTIGAYDSTFNGGTSATRSDAFVSRLDPKRTGTAQLVYSTILGGNRYEWVSSLFVDAGGVVTVAGATASTNFPTTSGAYDSTYNGGVSSDVFVSRLDPNKTGAAQLVFGTYLGGSSLDEGHGLSVDAGGVVTVAGRTGSTNFPTTSRAYDTIFNGGDAFVSRLDPNKTGTAQLVYGTFLGGSGSDQAYGLSVDTGGVLTVAGWTRSTNFPTTSGAYDTTSNGGGDAFVSRLDPSKTGAAQLVYGTYLGGDSGENAQALSVDARGVVTVTGWVYSKNFPTTSGAYDTTYNGNADGFVSRLDPNKTGTAQLVYSTFLGGRDESDEPSGLSVDAGGVVTVVGNTLSADFPTTSGAYDTVFNGNPTWFIYNVFVSRLDLSLTGTAQLIYSTFLGNDDGAGALHVDANGVATVAGGVGSGGFPTTSGAYQTTKNLQGDAFISRLSMGVAFYADRSELSLKKGGTQKLWLDAGKVHANRSYAIFGSVTGTSPGTPLLGIRIPLNVDAYTDITIGSAGPPVFVKFRGTLDGSGEATASFNVPALPTAAGITLHHAYIVFDSSGLYMASNPVPLRLK